jgi:hypothetical protein
VPKTTFSNNAQVQFDATHTGVSIVPSETLSHGALRELAEADDDPIPWVFTVTAENGTSKTYNIYVKAIEGSSSGVGWPDNSMLSKYGLSGMPTPAGATNIEYGEVLNKSMLQIYFDGSSASDTSINTWFTSNGWDGFGSLIPYVNYYVGTYTKEDFRAIYSRSDTDCSITVTTTEFPDFIPDWPDDTVLSEYGLSGMGIPTDATDIEHCPMVFNGYLLINFIGTSDSDTFIINWFDTKGWTASPSNGSSLYGGYHGVYTNGDFEATYGRFFDDDDGEYHCIIEVDK